MKTIWKSELTITNNEQLIYFPEGAEILSIQMQNRVPVIWCLCDSDKPKIGRIIQLLGTGHEILTEVEKKHISTVQDGPLVWHFFEMLK